MTKHQRQTMTARDAFCEPDGSYYCYYEGQSVRLWGTASDLRVRYLDTAVGYDVIAPDTLIEVEETEVRGSYDEVCAERDALAAEKARLVRALRDALEVLRYTMSDADRLLLKADLEVVLDGEDND